jgi:photosystem II stability/assembly factor-like uncharacterized protein
MAPRAFGFAAPQTIVTARDPASRWRIVPGGVERSTDGGATWRAQSVGTTVRLVAGASPSSPVCWLVGGMGTVLLSTDGSSWQRVAVPDSTASLIAVRATDAKSATVTASDGRTFTTTDGGVTWQR